MKKSRYIFNRNFERTNYQKGSGATVALPTVTGVTISGNPVVNSTLTVFYTLGGGIADTITRRWYRGATLIFTSTTVDTYVPIQADAGNTSNIKCVVDATNSAGTASADSNTVARILDQLANAYIIKIGGGLNSLETDAVNKFYLDVKSFSYENLIDNCLIYAGPTLNSALNSFFGNNVVTPVNSPAWSRKVGYTHTGTSYINRGTSSNVNFTRDNHVFMVGVSNKNTTTNGACGGFAGGVGAVFIVQNNAANTNTSSCGTQVSNVFARTIANKDYAIRRQSNTQYTVWQDGVSGSAINNTTNGTPHTNYFDGAYNGNGTPSTFFESGAITEYSLQGSGAIDPSVMRTIIRNFINSL